MTPEKQALLDAINNLVEDASPGYKRDAMEAVSRLRPTYPVAFTGKLRVLNPLLDMQLDAPAAWERIKHLIDDRRAKLDLEPIWPEPGRVLFKDRKNEYQRNLMASIRERCNRAVEIENMQRPEKDRLKGNPRTEFMKTVNHEWAKRRDAAIHAAAQAALPARLSRDQISTVRDRFWESIDRELDEREELVRQEILKPVHLRRKI